MLLVFSSLIILRLHSLHLNLSSFGRGCIWVDRVRCRPTFNSIFLNGHPVVPSPLTDKSLFPPLFVMMSLARPVSVILGFDSSGWFGGSACSLSPATWAVRGVEFICLCLPGLGSSCWITHLVRDPSEEKEWWLLPAGLWSWASPCCLRHQPEFCLPPPPQCSQLEGPRVLSPSAWFSISA